MFERKCWIFISAFSFIVLCNLIALVSFPDYSVTSALKYFSTFGYLKKHRKGRVEKRLPEVIIIGVTKSGTGKLF